MPPLRPGPAPAVLAAALAVALAGPGAAAAEPPASAAPVFVALTTDGAKVSGRLRGFGADGGVTLTTAEGADRALPIARLVKLTREGAGPAPAPEASVVLFPEGDRLYRTAVGAAGETALDVQSFTLGHLAIPLDSVLGLVLALPDEADGFDALVGKVRTEPRTAETVWLANGDRLTGGLLGLSDRAVELQAGKEAVKVERTGVVALGFDPALVNYPRPKGGFYEVTLSDGSRLGLSDPKLDEGNLVGASRFGVTVRMPAADVVRLHARTDSVVYLSEREPLDARYVPYVGPTRPYRRDASVEGHPLRMSGEVYERGIGTESRTLLAYRLQPGDRRFQAEVGVDDRAGPSGSVVFRVFVDKEEKYASPPMTARDAPRPVDLDLTGAKTLILITEFGERGGVRDLADWGEARVIR